MGENKGTQRERAKKEKEKGGVICIRLVSRPAASYANI